MVTQQAVRLGKSAVRPLQHLGQQSTAIQNLFLREIESLRRLSSGALREKYREVFG
jgi:hypothetical protein